MGCCVSTNKAPGKQVEAFNVKEAARDGESLPPLPPQEEETVKEVLSETPTPKLSFPNVEAQKIPKPSFPNIEKEKLSPPPTPPPPPPPLPPSFTKKVEEQANNIKRRTTPPPDPSPVVDEISEVSDMCSLSETVSTTTIGERYTVDDGEVRQIVDRSPAKVSKMRPVRGDSPGRAERGRKSSPARRLDRSPVKKNNNNAMKPSQIHHQSTNDVGGSGGGGGYTRRRRIQGSVGGVKRDPGESSGRRSRSPATRPALGWSPLSKAVMSPSRITALDQDKGWRQEEEREEGYWPTNESLENPLVSMECFIFL